MRPFLRRRVEPAWRDAHPRLCWYNGIARERWLSLPEQCGFRVSLTCSQHNRDGCPVRLPVSGSLFVKGRYAKIVWGIMSTNCTRRKWKFHWSEKLPLDEIQLRRLQNVPALYKIWRTDGVLLYVGETKALATRLGEHLHNPQNEELIDCFEANELMYFQWARAMDSATERRRVEAKIIREDRPVGNLLHQQPWYLKIWRWLKSYWRDQADEP